MNSSAPIFLLVTSITFLSSVLHAESILPLGPLKGLDHSSSAVYIEDIRNGEVILDFNSDKPLIPASITKAVTTACVLSTYGPDACFTTTVDMMGNMSGSTFEGDIVIHPVGDPTLGSIYFDTDSISFPREIANSLTEFGINHIRGSVCVASSMLVNDGVPSGWEVADLSLPYGAVFTPCIYSDNTFDFSIYSGKCSPSVPDIKISRSSTSTKKGRSVKVEKHPYNNKVTVRGQTKNHKATVTLPNSSPSLSLIADVCDTLKSYGFTLSSNNLPDTMLPNMTIVTHHSPSYGEIMRSLMHRSDNLYAEAMLRTLAPWGSRADALCKELSLLSLWDTDTTGVRIVDGSGLSRSNRMTANFMADVLYHMATGEKANDYIALFPKVGEEGTVKNLLTISPLRGALALKSGSMNGVRCYAGYKLDEAGWPTHVIVVMINDYRGRSDQLKNAIEELFLKEFS